MVTLGMSFGMALLVAVMSGPQYVYPAYGSSLATRFGWTALQNSLVSTASFIGVSFSGPLNAWLIETRGIPSGYFLLAQTYAGHLPDCLGLTILYLAMTGMAGASAYLCVLDSQSCNFITHRGIAMGLTSAALGLSGLVFSQINDIYFKSSAEQVDGTFGFLIFMAFAMAIGLFMGSTVLGPLQTHKKSKDYSVVSTEESQEKSPYSLPRPQEITGLELLFHPLSLALIATLFINIGVGYVYLASIGILVETLSPLGHSSQHIRNIHVSLFSIVNCFSRAFFGALSDFLKMRYGIHRLWIFWVSVVCLVLASVYMTMVKTVDDLIFSTFIIAAVYGIGFGVAPSITAELGIKAFAKNWGWILFAPAIGSQLFNILFGSLYDKEAKQQDSHVCYGTVCFRSTFKIAVVSSFLCLGVLTLAIVRLGLYRSQKSVHSLAREL
ncbi:major facilitator superfamily domain-containing protein [Spinellus fusiger]|nr:major facilitator superfamily domain-containing protein [Spinellus fusiger]